MSQKSDIKIELIIKNIENVRKTLYDLYKNKKIFYALFFDERPVNKKYFSKKQISILKATNLISEKRNYIIANFRVIKLETKRVNKIISAFIVTDKVSYKKYDQVMPLHPENQFVVDDIKIKNGDEILEIGIGSGVNAVFSILFGARKIIGLDINPRVSKFIKFNAALNLPKKDQNKIKIIFNKSRALSKIFDPIKNKKFDYIVTNPPFEPTPPKTKYFTHSGGGIYGMNVIEAILKKVKNHLKSKSYFQMVTFSPGNKAEPFILKEMLKNYLGNGFINLNKQKMKYTVFTKRFIELGYPKKKIRWMDEQAKKDKVTHLYLGMVHFTNDRTSVKIKPSKKSYKKWDIPIYSDVPMGFKPKKAGIKLN